MNKYNIINDPTYGMLFNKENFITPENYVFKNKGQLFVAVFEPAYEEDRVGYIAHRISIMKHDEYVGYIKICYKDPDVFKKKFPNVIYYASDVKGLMSGLSTQPKNKIISNDKEWEECSYEEKIDILKKLVIGLDYGAYRKLEESNSIDVTEWYNSIHELIEKKYGQEYQDIINNKSQYNVPIIEFVSVRGNNGLSNKLSQRNSSKEIKEYCKKINKSLDEIYDVDTGNNYQGTGLSLEIYKLGADWMALNGLVLRSGLLNDFSKSMWSKKMKSDPRFNVVKENDDMYLDHKNMDLSYLNLKKQKANKKLKNQ